MDLSDLHTEHFTHGVKFPPHTKVVAVGRGIDGNLISTAGILNANSCESRHLSSSCKISEVCQGGPLFDFDGNFVGIKLCLGTDRTIYLPMFTALPWFKACRYLQNIMFPFRHGLNKDLEYLGYPKPLNDGMVLVNSFEEPFGDEFGEGVWNALSKTTSGILERNIVALASFRVYAEGTLQHVNLHYNVALVSVKDFCAPQPIEVKHRWPDSGEVLAVGRCFRSGSLMVARGQMYPRPEVRFDCKYLGYSTCKITKAGIGGPLLDPDGEFVGMNFYDKDVGHTPYLSWWEILPLLDYFKTKGTVAEGSDCGNPSDKPDWAAEGDDSVFCNSWFVPSPCWHDPDVLEKVEFEAASRVPRYTIEFEFESDSSDSSDASDSYKSESESE
uniref:Uncharacterized protein n=1 Tax=Avena sativa TaxID=4498 RepID=A0ACD5XQW9_AVESA